MITTKKPAHATPQHAVSHVVEAMPEAVVRPGNASRADYPRMLYHPDGRTITVADPEEHDKLAKEGWDTVPPPNYVGRKPTPSIAPGSGDALSQMIRAVFEAVLDERGFKKKDAHNGTRKT